LDTFLVGLVVLFVLLVLSILGHAFWLLAGWCLQTLLGAGVPLPQRARCARCGGPLEPRQVHCPHCRLGRTSAVAATLTDLAATTRQLERLQESCALPASMCEQVLQVVRQERDRLCLFGQPVAAAPAAAACAAVLAENLPAPKAIPIFAEAVIEPEIPPVVLAREADQGSPSAAHATVSADFEATETPALPTVVAMPESFEREPVLLEEPRLRVPRRPFTELLTAFMEQRNILWGELLSGLLIVGCSIMLVIYLWKAHEGNPLYQFGIFVGATTALFSAGLYTLRHWKLETTSRGLLIIATLLVPLNFLAMVAQATTPSSVLEILLEVTATGIFLGLLAIVARVLVPDAPWLFIVAMLGTSASQVLIPRLLNHNSAGSAWLLALAGSLPLSCYLVGLSAGLVRSGRRHTLTAPQLHGVLALMGIPLFALAIALGLVMHWSIRQGHGIGPAAAHLSVLAALAGVPLVGGGLLVNRNGAHGVFRTAGTAITLFGLLVMAAAGVLAWPYPIPLAVVCGINFVILTAAAFRLRLPAAHALALPSLLAGWLAVYHLALDHVDYEQLAASMSALALSADTGYAIAPLALGLCLGAELLLRYRRAIDGLIYACCSGIAVVLSLMLVSLPTRTLAQPMPAFLLIGCYGAGVLANNARWRRPWLSSLGLALLIAATLLGLWWPISPAGWEAPHGVPAFWGAVLACEALAMVLAANWLADRATPLPEAASSTLALADAYREPLARSAESTTVLAVIASAWAGWNTGAWALEHVASGLSLFLVYLLLAAWERRAVHIYLAGGAFSGTAAALAGWLVTSGQADLRTGWIALAVGASGLLMALGSVLGIGTASGRSRSQLASAWRVPATGAGILALVLIAVQAIALSTPLLSGTLLLVALTALVLAFAYAKPVLTWVGALLLIGAITDTLRRLAPGVDFPIPLLALALLLHVTLALAIAATNKRSPRPWDRLCAGPFGQVGLVTSVLALPLLCLVSWGKLTTPAIGLFWLAALWLAVAWVRRWPGLFAVAQVVLAAGVILTCTIGLEATVWFGKDAPSFLRLGDPRALHVYGIGLALFSLGWLLARLVLRQDAWVQALLEPAWPACDRVVLLVLVFGQAVLAACTVAPAVDAEIRSSAQLHFYQALLANFVPGASTLLALLAIVLIVGLRERRGAMAAAGLVVLALTVPLVAAASLAVDGAVAATLRWGSAVSFLLISIASWARPWLGRLAARLGWQLESDFNLPRVTRTTLLIGAVLPVLLLTLADGGARCLGWQPAFPAVSSFFGRIGWLTAELVPLAIITFGLVGHAVVEKSPGYAFGAGLVATALVMGGHALAHLGAWDVTLVLEILQLGTITAAAWAIGWLVIRSRVLARGKPRASRFAQPLLKAQIGLAVVGLATVAGVGIGLLGAFYPARLEWTAASGSILGWLTLGATAAALVYHFVQRRSSVPPVIVGWLAFTALGLVACTVERAKPGFGYWALLVAWAGYPAAWVLFAWLRKPSVDPPLVRAAAFWVGQAGVLVVLLSLKAALLHHDFLWAAGALALVSPAAATIAIWLHREGWAFVAGLGVNLAVSLVVWHIHAFQAVAGDAWWLPLVQANLIAGAGVACLWLGLRKRLYAGRLLGIHSAPWLVFQIAALLVSNGCLLAVAAGGILLHPDQAFPSDLLVVGRFGQAAATAITLVAVAGYVAQMRPAARPHVAGIAALALGTWLACATADTTAPNWLAYHAAIGAWMLIAFALLIAAWSHPRPAAGEFSTASARRSAGPMGVIWPRTAPWLAAPVIQAWVLALGALVALLAIWATWLADPWQPSSSAGPTLAVALLTAGVALWRGERRLLHLFGILLNIAGAMLWLTARERTIASFGCVQVLCLALGAAACSAVRWLPRHIAGQQGGHEVSYPRAAGALAVVLMTLLVAAGVWAVLTGAAPVLDGALPWIALGALAMATVLLLWDVAAQWALVEIYTTFLLAVGLPLVQRDGSPRGFLWLTSIALSLSVLLVAAVYWRAQGWSGIWKKLRLPELADRAPQRWLVPAQSGLTIASAALSIWMVLDFASVAERIGGPAAVIVLCIAAILLANAVPSWQPRLALASLLLGVLAATETGWVLVIPDGHGPAWLWLHRNVWTLVALAFTSLMYGVGLARHLPPGGWAACCRRLGPWLGVVGCLLLAVILIQEAWLYEGCKTIAMLVSTGPNLVAPAASAEGMMAPVAVAIVGLALLGLMAAGLAFAVIPGTDPLGLSVRGRKAYVYAAEVLVLLMFVHFRLTLPQLFRPGLVAQHWPFILMTVAFGGAGLSEFCRRRRLPVLAEPLERTGIFLPMLPVLAFWVLPESDYALLWFLAGLLYGLVSVFKRSFVFAVAAALAANMGLWVTLHVHRFAFLEHPQLWLIPIAFIGLVAEYQNHDRLLPHQSAGIRYLALIVIYVSSSADMFIARLDQSVLPPLILASLSIVGVLTGMLLRVRAFLFLGATFLLFVVVTMIWHAAVEQQQTWILWSFGIVVGICLLTLFGVFEKRRNDVLHLMDELRQWR
jgi:hypothetical protein